VSKPYPYFSGHSGARPRRLSDLLNQHDFVFSELQHQVQVLQHLNALLSEFLDEPLLEHVKIAAVDNDEHDNARGSQQLVLAADSPVWGHRVRYLAPAIVEFLHSRGEIEHIQTARILVRPPLAGFKEPRSLEPGPNSNGISDQSARLLEQVAEELDNPKLSEQLRQMSQRAKLNSGANSAESE
jgi:hypothetical protein